MANYQEFNGIRFYQTSPSDYFRHIVGRTSIIMHRYVWEYYNGMLPPGYEVHHIDFNRANNDISNLQAMPINEHKKLHAELLSDEQREWRRWNLDTNARPKAIEWHKSEEGRNWHSTHAKEMQRPTQHNICVICGRQFDTVGFKPTKYCCGACKAKGFRLQKKQKEGK